MTGTLVVEANANANTIANTDANATTGSGAAQAQAPEVNQIATPGSTVLISPGSSMPNPSKTFDPPILAVSKGTTVLWKNDDSSLHTVTSGTAEGDQPGAIFDSSYLAAGNSFQWTFNDVGTFDYYCTLHPTMIGKVIVDASASANANTNDEIR